MSVTKKPLLSILAGVAAGFLWTGGADLRAQTCDPNVIPAGPLRYDVVAGGARLNRKTLGTPTRYIRNVAAEPVDSFVYDGVGSVPIEGLLHLIVDPVAEVGLIEASWTDSHGDWTYTQAQFYHPEHWSGVRLGSSATSLEYLINEAITTDVYLHGDTDAGMPVLPTVFAHLATWGHAVVTLNGELFANPFEFPNPDWIGHVMVTEGVRWPDGTIRNASGGTYSPMHPTDGSVENGDLEVHLVFHDERYPETGNFPPIFQFFYHLVFEDVSISTIQNTSSIVIEPEPVLEPAPKRTLPRRR